MRAILVISITLAAAGSANAGERYVSPDGSDRAAGTATAPWRTLQRAADAAEAGTVNIVRPGRYRGFDLRASGAKGRPIRFAAEAGAIITSNNRNTPDGINIEHADYVEISGFTITGAERAGIRAVQSHHVTLRENRTIDNGRWGIFTGFCADLLIEGNETAGSVREHGIYVSNSSDRPIIRRNLIHGNRQAGIHINGDKSMGGDGIISDALVEDNLIYDNGPGGASGINCDGVQSSVLRNNLIYAEHASGISLYRIDGGEPSYDNLVINNTVLVAGDGRWALNIQDGSARNTARNNILLNAHPRKGSIDVSKNSLPGFISDNNLVVDRFAIGDDPTMTLEQWQARTGNDRASKVTTIAEVFADTKQFRTLASASPAIDNGVATDAPKTDLLGNPRPIGAGVDIGAVEYCSGDCVDTSATGSNPSAGSAPAPATTLTPSTGAQSRPSQNATKTPTQPRKSSGCRSCGVASDQSSSGGGLLLALLVGLHTMRRCRRPGQRPPHGQSR